MKKIIYFIVGTYVLVYLFQSLDKTCKRKTLFDKVKIPALSSALMGIIALHLTDEKPTFFPIILPFTSKPPKVDGQSIFTDLGNF